MKGMQRIRRGSGFLGVLSYLLDHDEPDFVGGTVTVGTALQMTREFVAVSETRPDIKKPVWHNSLRLPAGEHLPMDKWAEVAHDYMREMGYSESAQWVVIRHNNPEGDHIHIVANRVLLDGSIYYGRDDNLRSTRVITELEKKYGLTVTKVPDIDDNGNVIMPDTTKPRKDEIDKSIRTGNAPIRTLLQSIIDEALTDRPTVWDFIDRLHNAGVNVRPNIASTGRVNGLAFEFDGITYSGSKLGKKYGWTKLQKSIDYRARRDNPLFQQLKKQAIKNDEIAANRAAGTGPESAASTPGQDNPRAGPPHRQNDSFTPDVGRKTQTVSNDEQAGQRRRAQASEQSGHLETSGKHAGVETGQNHDLRSDSGPNNNNPAVDVTADNKPSPMREREVMTDKTNIHELKAVLARKKREAEAVAEQAKKKRYRKEQARKWQSLLVLEGGGDNSPTADPEKEKRFLKTIELVFEKKGHKYFRKSTGKLAFYETDDKIISGDLDPDETTIKAMSQAAQIKFGNEWRSTGPEKYVRESWFQAAMMGCNDVGLNPSPDDWQELKKRMVDYEHKYGQKPPRLHPKISNGLRDHEIGLEILALPDVEESETETDSGSTDPQYINKPEPGPSFANRLNAWREKKKRKKETGRDNSNQPKPSPGH